MPLKLSPGISLTQKGSPLTQAIPAKYNVLAKPQKPKPVPQPNNRYSDPPVGGYNPEQVALSGKKAKNPYAKALNNTA